MKRNINKIIILSLLIFSSLNNLWAQPSCLGTQGELKWLLWEKESDDEVDDLIHLHSFPNNPDVYELLTGIKSLGAVSDATKDGIVYESVRYGDEYGSMVRGYLTVPESGNYTFNLTGDDEVRFLLSTDDTKDNLALNTYITTWTYRKEFAKAEETNQTSATISLTTGNYYYFEIWHKEHSGGDHFEVLWKTPTNSTDWHDIADTLLYDYACSLDCPPSGTTCDDGNATTSNDQEDGFCNCIGTPNDAPACVGKLGEVKAMYYLDLTNNRMDDFLESDKYPLMPDTIEMLESLQGPFISRDTYGTKVAGFLKVPVTGDYQFNVTASDRASFELSTTDSPSQLVELSFTNYSAEHEHNRYEYQLNPPVTLDKDEFYYFELHHVEGSGSDRFNVFWKTPFTQDTLWRTIDKAYIYGYACELACIPEGTPCDDGNNFTKNDKYDAECNCIGEPCRDCDETPPLAYTPTEECGVSDDLDNSAIDAWESCTPKPNPNTGRGTSHWIQYDLGQDYLLNETHIWNYNATGATGKGFKEVVVDYSSDGTNWTQLGDIYQWEQATGVVGYEGFEGPNFNGITARYILLTALNNWDNGLCAGFSKITINATDCLLMGQSCDDGEADSVNDRYDENCNCVGEGAGFSETLCGETELVQENIVLTGPEYYATARIISQGMIDPGGDVKLIAGESVTLMDGFHARAGSQFLANIGTCEPPTPSIIEEATNRDYSRISENEETLKENHEFAIDKTTTFAFEDLGKTNLRVFPNPSNSWTSLQFNLPYAAVASLCVYTTDGKNITCLATDNAFSEGIYTKEFPAQRLAAGMYYVVLKTDKEVLTKPLVVIE